MNNLNLDGNVSDSSGFPVKSGTWNFLQNANKEVLNALSRNIVGKEYSPSIPYILFGCEKSVAGPNNQFSEGAIFFNGEIYYSPAQTVIIPSGGSSVYARLKITQYSTNADPVEFTDGVTKDVHDIRRVEYYNASTSTGATFGLFSDFKNQDKWNRSTEIPTVTSPTVFGFIADSMIVNYSRWQIIKGTCFWQLDLQVDINSGAAIPQIIIDYPTGFPIPDKSGGVFFGKYNDNIIMVSVGISGVVLTLLGANSSTSDIVTAGAVTFPYGGTFYIGFSINFEITY